LQGAGDFRKQDGAAYKSYVSQPDRGKIRYPVTAYRLSAKAHGISTDPNNQKIGEKIYFPFTAENSPFPLTPFPFSGKDIYETPATAHRRWYSPP
jgi:hypothetical protein